MHNVCDVVAELMVPVASVGGTKWLKGVDDL